MASDQYPPSNGPHNPFNGQPANPYGGVPQPEDPTHVIPAVQDSADQAPPGYVPGGGSPWGGQSSASQPPVQQPPVQQHSAPATYGQNTHQSSAGAYPGQGWGGEQDHQQQVPQTQPSGSVTPLGAPQPSPRGVGYTAQVPPPTPRAGQGDSNPVVALLDFSFNRYATPGLIKIVYILAIVVAVLCWIGGGISTIVAGVQLNAVDDGFGTPVVVLGVFALVLGWIPALLGVALTRIVLEFSAATVRTNTAVREIVDRLDRP